MKFGIYFPQTSNIFERDETECGIWLFLNEEWNLSHISAIAEARGQTLLEANEDIESLDIVVRFYREKKDGVD